MASPSPRFAPRDWLEDPLFRGHDEALTALLEFDTWPSANELHAALSALVERGLGGPMRFRAQVLHEPLRYEAAIVTAREVPTRDASPHDLLNALIWATFPRAKFALHRRFHEAEQLRTVPGRTRFQDRLALLDEGAVLRSPDGNVQRAVVFGHAILEHRIGGSNAARAELFELTSMQSAPTPAIIDEAFATTLCGWPDPAPPRIPGIPILELFPEATV